MRVISGLYRGRRLNAPEGVVARPTTDRVRESLFAILQPRIPGARVLDLFTGTGVLAIESLSRGASFAVLCDVSPKSAAVARKNLDACAVPPASARFMRMNAASAIRALHGETFDIVFLDPPYAAGLYEPTLTLLAKSGLLAPDGCVVLEHPSTVAPPYPPAYIAYDTRRYGTVGLTFLRAAAET